MERKRLQCNSGHMPAVGRHDVWSPIQTSWGITEVSLHLFSAPSPFCFPLICVAACRLLAVLPLLPGLNEPRICIKTNCWKREVRVGDRLGAELSEAERSLWLFNFPGVLVERLYVIFPITWSVGRSAQWSHFSRRLGRLIINTLPRGWHWLSCMRDKHGAQLIRGNTKTAITTRRFASYASETSLFLSFYFFQLRNFLHVEPLMTRELYQTTRRPWPPPQTNR